jgi:opacity protein-like surface antigen
MLKRKLTIAAALAAALLAPAMASASADGWRYVGGEADWVFVMPEPSRLTRAEVQRALSTPMESTDGWRYVGGEAGWVVEVARYRFVNGQLVHAEDCLFDPSKYALIKPAAPDPRDPLQVGA